MTAFDEPLAGGLNGETAVDRFLDEPSDRGPAGDTWLDAGRLKSCYSNAQPSRLPLQLCHGNNKAHSSWFVGSTEAIVMHNHRGLTRTINANHGRGNPHVSLIAMKR